MNVHYSINNDVVYPSDYLHLYSNLPDDLIVLNPDQYQVLISARAQSLPYLFENSEFIVAPSAHHEYDKKTKKWVLNEAKKAEVDAQAAQAELDSAKSDKTAEINSRAQAYIDSTTGADKLPAFEVQGWAIQGAEAKAWHTDPTAPTPTLDAIAAARGIPPDALRAGAYKKTMLYEGLVASVTGQRQKFNDLLRAAKSTEAVRSIVVVYG